MYDPRHCTTRPLTALYTISPLYLQPSTLHPSSTHCLIHYITSLLTTLHTAPLVYSLPHTLHYLSTYNPPHCTTRLLIALHTTSPLYLQPSTLHQLSTHNRSDCITSLLTTLHAPLLTTLHQLIPNPRHCTTCLFTALHTASPLYSLPSILHYSPLSPTYP